MMPLMILLPFWIDLKYYYGDWMYAKNIFSIWNALMFQTSFMLDITSGSIFSIRKSTMLFQWNYSLKLPALAHTDTQFKKLNFLRKLLKICTFWPWLLNIYVHKKILRKWNREHGFLAIWFKLYYTVKNELCKAHYNVTIHTLFGVCTLMSLLAP